MTQALSVCYTMKEAAERLHKKRRWLQDWLRDHPADAAGTPFYSPLGRTKTFDDGDIARIRAAAREEERCRLNLSRRGKAKARTGRFVAPISADMLTEALGLAGERLPAKCLNRSSDQSNVANFPSAANRPSRARRRAT